MRTLFLSLSLLSGGILSGCGFTPMHASAPDGTSLSDISVSLVKGSRISDNQAGFFLTQRLRDRLGKASAASPYEIKVVPTYRRTRLGLTEGDVATRYDVTVRVKWELIQTKTGKVVDKGVTSTVSTFGAPEGPYGVITADNIGVQQASKQTADKLVIELASYFAKQSKTN